MSKAQNVTFGNRNEQAQAELASTKAQLADELRARELSDEARATWKSGGSTDLGRATRSAL